MGGRGGKRGLVGLSGVRGVRGGGEVRGGDFVHTIRRGEALVCV